MGAAARREWTARAALLGTALVVGLATAEAVARPLFRQVRPGPPARVEFQGASLRFESGPDGFSAVHSYNSLGYRDREWPDTAGPRVGCYGDSFTAGMGARDGHTWPDALGRRLGPAWTVLNLGEVGAGPHGYAANLRATLRPLGITHAVVTLNSGDLLGTRGAYVARPDDPLPKTFGEQAPPRSPWERLLPGLAAGWRAFRGQAPPQRAGAWWQPTDVEALAVFEVARVERVTVSRARGLVRERLGRVRPACLAAARQGRFNPWNVVHLLVEGRDGPQLDDVEASFGEWMSWLARSVGPVARLLVVYYPDPSPEGPLGCWQGPPRAGADRERLRALVAAAARGASLPWIDATDALAAAGDAAYLRYDGHPTEAAHAIVGALVASHLAGS
ncbi:MAG: hypothetical protein KJ067_18865 [Vicinamibacteria bacterium]|nr:hypothetical protein [Vicinamibacteria bacterium]